MRPHAAAPARFAFPLALLVALLAVAGCRSSAVQTPVQPPAAGGAAPAATAAAGTLITGVTLISPERAAPLADAWVAIEGETIAAVGSGPPPAAMSDWPRVDGAGGFLIPGLIDGHVHLQSVPGLTWDRHRNHRKLVDAYFEQLPRSYLYYGFTTVVDLAPQDPKVMRRVAASDLAPDVFGCGPPVPIANGYPMVFAPHRFRFMAFPNFLWDPAQADSMPGSMTPAEHGPDAVVARVVEAEGLCVKTFVEDGFGPAKRWPVPAAELVAELSAATGRAGLPLLVHANSFDSYEIALDGEADILVHGLWTWDEHTPAAGDQPEAGLPAALAQLVERIVAAGTGVMPTLQVLAGDGALFEPEFLEDHALPAVLPPDLLAWYSTPEGAWFAEQLLSELPPEMATEEAALAAHAAAMDRGQRVTRALADGGARLIFGSDTPSGPSYGNPPGYNGYLELQQWQAAGVPPARVLAAATIDTAAAFGLDDRYGTIEEGKVANLLLLRDDPSKSTQAYSSLETVVLRGTVLARGDLAATAP